MDGQKVVSGAGVKKGTIVDDEMLEALEKDQWFKLRFSDDAINSQLETAETQLGSIARAIEARFEDKKRKLQAAMILLLVC